MIVQLNQPQKDHFNLQVQLQTPLGAFPQVADAIQVRPEAATRFAGYFRIVNEGAVRLEVAQVSGLSQISPEQFPETDVTKAAFRTAGPQRFAYRFSGADFALKIQADQILPELAVSEVLAYHLAESELDLDGEIEIDIREAPLRELVLRVPKGYALAKLTASGLSDYFLREPADQPDAELRLVYGQPVSGRQIIQLRLEHNQPLGTNIWVLPRLEVAKAKSTRGHVAISSDAGFRVTPERTQALTEIATAFFPRKVTGIQSAFRLSEPAWEATVRVERLPKTVQTEVFHLFSIGEGIAYGSSVANYQVSGAPMSTFRVELSDEYKNVEFTGKDLRNWQKTDGGFLVQLHTPVAGSYTLLATYERPFKAQGETLAFTGARPLDAQAEQGHTLIISTYQFQVKPVAVSPGLLALEPGEVPSEYRLFFDAPILAAYRYTSRPFSLKLALSPLAQGDSLQPGCRPRHAEQPNFERRPDYHRRPLFRKKSGQPESPPDAAAGYPTLVRHCQRRAGRAGDRWPGEFDSPAPTHRPERRPPARFETRRARVCDARHSHRCGTQRRRARHARGMEGRTG